ncbi:flagellin N-terminal helical domain-containing protein [Amnibacterium sp.]|uniref:flagellin N-terminal helical domain-containing protein n=1 Tax=Amnibacterium sp. TaxID=1872496 RepID=UPI003F7C3A22
MAFTINTNLDALNTYRNLTNTQNSLSSSLAKLSSGLRINNAGDDAAGLTIATALGSQVSGLQQASRNAQDGTSVVQTADGALGQAQSLLGRLRDLAVQAANDSNSTSARAAITTEATSITAELTRLGNSVNFNGKNLLDGSAGTLNFQVGADGNSQSQIGVNLSSANLVQVASNLGNAGASFDVTSPTTVAGAQKFTNGTTDVSVTLGAAGTYKTVQSVADALNGDSNFASTFSASVNGNNQLVVTSLTGGTVTGGTHTTAAAAGTGISTGTAITGGLDFSSASGAQAAITAIDGQIQVVSTARSNIGALENRFASAVSTISTSITNLTAAKSRITDVDMASEMVNYSRANILSQSGTAMLAQANSLPQLALKLLG